MAKYRIIRVENRSYNPRYQVEEAMSDPMSGDPWWYRHDRTFTEEREAYSFVEELRREYKNKYNPEVIREFD